MWFGWIDLDFEISSGESNQICLQIIYDQCDILGDYIFLWDVCGSSLNFM